MTEPCITFESSNGRELLLTGTHYDVTIEGLMATTTISQYYTNPHKENIEAVYTFPMHPDAVLLDLDVRINERQLRGTITEKREAEARYEEAIDEGNRAIMVEKSSEGIYTVSIANILHGDRITVQIRYTQLLEWRQDKVKWTLPTTIAPKYGDPVKLGLDDVTMPEVTLFAENRFALRMVVKGILAESRIAAPSHQVVLERSGKQTNITLADETDFMNKDLVFTFATDKSREERSFALLGKEREGYAAIASFYPSFGEEQSKAAKSVTFVIDCSGSMSGVSIARARTALMKALNLLDEEDSFNIVKFGSDHTLLFDEEVAATQANLDIAKSFVGSLDANMGGTDMESALSSAYKAHRNDADKLAYLFLITDGEIYDHRGVIANAKKSEMAHYVVGVGYASDDALLRRLAKETRGSFESIDPNEKMDEYILNLFKKIDLPKAEAIEVKWSATSSYESVPNVLFDGDTFYAYACFDEKPHGDVTLNYKLENGQRYSMQTSYTMVEDENPSVIAKIVVAEEIKKLSTEIYKDYYIDTESEAAQKIVALSTEYQLFSELTNYILVDEIAETEKPDELPRTQKVESMMVDTGDLLSVPTFMKKPTVEFSLNSRDVLPSQASFWDPVVFDDVNISYDHGVLHNVISKVAKITKRLINRVDEDIEFERAADEFLMESFIYNMEEEKLKSALLSLQLWYERYQRLPRKQNEIELLGLGDELVALFKGENIREMMQLFIEESLERLNDTSFLDEKFVTYLKEKYESLELPI